MARVELTGRLQPGVTGKDVIITLCGLFNKDEVLNHGVEFVGSGVSCLTIEERMTIANMTTEWGALVGLFPCDSLTTAWLGARASKLASAPYTAQRNGAPHPRITTASVDRLRQQLSNSDSAAAYAPDANARYSVSLSLDLSSVVPHASGPNTVKVMNSVRALEQQRIRIQKAYIVSCVNSRVDDLSQAAQVIRGKKVWHRMAPYGTAPATRIDINRLHRTRVISSDAMCVIR